MPKAITPDDLEVGQFVTIGNGETMTVTIGPGIPIEANYLQSLYGVPVKILAIDRPMIAACLVQNPEMRLSIDTGRCQLYSVPEDYALALAPSAPRKWWQFWKKG